MNSLITLDNLSKAKELIEQANFSQLKEIIARTDALKVYAAQAKKGLEIQNQVAEVKLRAEKRIGELLKDSPKNKGAQGRGVPSHDVTAPTLKDLGIERMQSVRWQAVASLPDKDFEKHIAEVKASNEELTTVGVIRIARDLNLIKRNKELQERKSELPKEIFQVIYCDPPWEYSNSGLGGSAKQHYPTMSTEEICQIPVNKITDNNCVIFIWATNPLLEDSLKVIRSWGFEYKTNFVWVKNRETYGKLGFYVYGQHELLLIGIKGSMLPIGEKPKSIISGDNTVHSKKPECVYEIIESMYPNLKYVELFSRNKRIHWTGWGLEYEK